MSVFLPGDLIVFEDDAMLVLENAVNTEKYGYPKYTASGLLVKRGWAWSVDYDTVQGFLDGMNKNNRQPPFTVTFVRPE